MDWQPKHSRIGMTLAKSASPVFLEPALMDELRDVVIVTTPDGVITWCNRAVASVFGYAAEDLVGRSLSVLYPPKDQLYVADVLLAQVHLQQHFSGEVRNLGKQGNPIDVHLTAGLLCDEQKEVSGVLLFIRDETPQKLAGVDEGRRFEILTQAIPQLIWWADRKGSLNYVTSRTTSYFGVALECLAHEGWLDFVHPDDRERSRTEWQAAVSSCRPYELEHRLRRHDGEYVLHLATGDPILESDGNLTGFVSTSTDVSVRSVAANALRVAEKLAVAGKLASSISHEINNPLEAVTNLLYLIGSNPSLNRTARDYVKLAEEELARMGEIVRQTLRFHRQSTAETPVRMPDLMDSVLAVFKPRIDAGGLKLSRDYRKTEPVLCFSGEIRQVLSNLISNALDATPPGGRLIARLRPARRWDAQGQRGVRITLADTGKGISPEHRRRIFEPFYTTKGINGTGLGMWISKDLIEKHEGVIRFCTSARETASGTTFSVFLPYGSFRTARLESWRDEKIPAAAPGDA